MLHIYCENCDGWVSFPAGGSHKCGFSDVAPAGNIFIGGDDWFTDDSDY